MTGVVGDRAAQEELEDGPDPSNDDDLNDLQSVSASEFIGPSLIGPTLSGNGDTEAVPDHATREHLDYGSLSTELRALVKELSEAIKHDPAHPLSQNLGAIEAEKLCDYLDSTLYCRACLLEFLERGAGPRATTAMRKSLDSALKVQRKLALIDYSESLQRFKKLAAASVAEFANEVPIDSDPGALANGTLDAVSHSFERGAKGLKRAFLELGRIDSSVVQPESLESFSTEALVKRVSKFEGAAELANFVRQLDVEDKSLDISGILQVAFLKLAKGKSDETIEELLPTNAHTAWWGIQYLSRDRALDFFMQEELPTSVAESVISASLIARGMPQATLRAEDFKELALNAPNPKVRKGAMKCVEGGWSRVGVYSRHLLRGMGSFVGIGRGR